MKRWIPALVALLVFASLPVTATPLDDLVAELKTIDRLDDQAMPRALAAFGRLRAAEPSLSARDSAIFVMREFYTLLVQDWNERIEDLQSEKEMAAFRRRLKSNGLTLASSEGMYYVREQADYFYRRVAIHGSPAWSEFARLRAVELKQGFCEDASLVITWRALGDRVLAWERYLDRYCDGMMGEPATYLYRLYLTTLLSGTDNTPVFGENGLLKPQVKAEYARIVKCSAGTRTGRLVADYRRVLIENQWRDGAYRQEFLAAHKVLGMIGEETPVE